MRTIKELAITFGISEREINLALMISKYKVTGDEQFVTMHKKYRAYRINKKKIINK